MEIWSPRINYFFRTKLVAARFFDDYSSDVADGGDIVHIPNITDGFTPADIATTNGAVTSTNLSDTNSTLNINNWKGVAYDLTDYQFSQILKSYNIKNAYAQSMAYSLAKKFDSDVLANAANVTASVGDSGSSLLATTIESAFGILESNSIPKDELVFFLDPKVYWGDIMSIQKYYDASQFGKPSLPEGAHDMLYGVPVVLTSQLPGATGGGKINVLVHKSAIIYALGRLNGAMQNGVRIQEKPSENLKTRFIGDIIYGVGNLNTDAGVQILSDE